MFKLDNIDDGKCVFVFAFGFEFFNEFHHKFECTLHNDKIIKFSNFNIIST
jgi:hypothetical protein